MALYAMACREMSCNDNRAQGCLHTAEPAARSRRSRKHVSAAAALL